MSELFDRAVRFSGGGSLTHIDAEARPDDGTKVTDDADGERFRGRVELTSEKSDHLSLGTYLGGSHATYDTVVPLKESTIGAGVAARGYLGKSALRPYLEARAGYRHSFIEIGDGSRDGAGYEVGAGVGLEYSLSRTSAIFLQLDYELGGAFISDQDFESMSQGFGVMLGGSVSF